MIADDKFSLTMTVRYNRNGAPARKKNLWLLPRYAAPCIDCRHSAMTASGIPLVRDQKASSAPGLITHQTMPGPFVPLTLKIQIVHWLRFLPFVIRNQSYWGNIASGNWPQVWMWRTDLAWGYFPHEQKKAQVTGSILP
ncbi:hypothetical protein BL250_15765 [Erwinia sp. OLTSP20]|nr:hypothetical protein BV501_17145 [Erwinia sp. OAMSP11]PIJ68419.1 hypothetical protein BK416_16495 [Erwinia sp. OLSSP12]PIJ79077.1 hypothetical protein BLD47_15590 [Erwinia sp. OLCASP19]PIJ79545.1 hypothetical protein BLD46_16710 [Erwinia sp. OLMTSP26]PIJ81848.1 hypothetical protein BLD49_15945 [Erwinia sp. OLMDSP33]PIJ89172.1 hypothetical protein BL249_17265 [Erwinia sp. OLFS4]PIJ89388.1 hypothetical protein BL250_15765 [Erwinia sp. OLTSP20]